MYFDTLQSLGLSGHEQAVYIFLLKNGKSTPTEIEQGERMHRPIVYRAISSLLGKGLLKVFTKGKRKYYVAESPDALAQLFKRTEERFVDDIEDLHQLHNKNAGKPMVTFSEGRRAIEEAYLDVPRTVEKDGTYYRYISSSELNRTRFLPKTYREQRNKKGLSRYIICNKAIQKKKPSLGAEVKVIPEKHDLFADNISQVIYKDKVAIVDFDTESVITIQSQKFADFQKKIFKILYERL